VEPRRWRRAWNSRAHLCATRLIFDLHGGGVSATSPERGSGFQPLADKENCIYIAPDAIDMMWSANAAGLEGADRDELFLRALLERVGAAGCVDLRRIYSTGCSMGGAQSFELACFASDVVTAIAPWCGTSFFELFTQCKPKRPVSVMLTLGENDMLNCWEGDSPPVGKQCAKGVQEAFKMIDKCTGQITQTLDGHCETIDQCERGTEVVICKVGTGHVVYGTTDLDLPQVLPQATEPSPWRCRCSASSWANPRRSGYPSARTG
jgi:poly(3-hydroxybutyrate) depolymerase